MVEPEMRLPGLLPPPADASWWQWLQSHSGLLGWMFVLSLGSLLLTVLLLPVFVVRLPADHFVVARREVGEHRGVGRWIARLGKNLLGIVFVLAGVAMLVLPGQGLLTILIGLLLLEFPGKRALERKLVRRPAILNFLNAMRARREQPPLLVD